MAEDFDRDMDFPLDEMMEAEEKKRFPTKLIIIMMVLSIVGGGGVAWYFFKSPPGDPLPVVEKPVAAPVFENIYALETFSIHLADMGGRIFRVKIELDLADPVIRGEIDRRLARLRNAVEIILKSKTLDEIETVSGKIKLKTEIIKKINRILETGRIRNLYFSGFVVL